MHVAYETHVVARPYPRHLVDQYGFEPYSTKDFSTEKLPSITAAGRGQRYFPGVQRSHLSPDLTHIIGCVVSESNRPLGL